MQLYKTAEEIAVAWNITPRHVQHLCRNGKVEGAVKRAGAWFIPDDALPPIRNTKSNVQGYMFVGTKSRIFSAAIHLFVQKGFSNVSIKDIADAVGIRQSTIYNHFKSKQEILDTIYDYYQHHYLLDRPTVEDLSDTINYGSMYDIIRSLSYDFSGEYMERMSEITKIFFQRIAIDKRAREINKSLMDSGVEFARAVLKKTLETGRFKEFDPDMLSFFVNSIRTYTLHHWIANPSPDNLKYVTSMEFNLYKKAAEIIESS